MSDIQVGTRLMTYADFERLPVGSVIGPRGSSGRTDTFTKQTNGSWTSNRYGSQVNVADFDTGGYNDVKEVGPEGVALESLRQWQWRFWDNAQFSAEQAGVSRDVVDGVMRNLNLDADMFPLGAGARINSNYFKEQLPEGSVIVKGEPERLNEFGLFTRVRGGWSSVLGSCSGHNGYPVTVLTGEPALWAITPGTVDEQDALASFKAKAWKIGWKVKRSHRWCESYEGYMARVGLDDSVLRGVGVNGIQINDMVNQTQAATLPVGSVLRWTSRTDPATFTWYRREVDATVVAGTRALFGHRTDGVTLRNSAQSMEVMFIPDHDGECEVDIATRGVAEQIAPHIPVGSLVETGDGTVFMIDEDHRVSVSAAQRNGTPRARGEWDLTQVDRPFQITRFGR